MSNFIEFLRRAQAGDQLAFEALIQEFGWVVENVCRRRIIATPVDISGTDLKQEVWLKVWGNLAGFKCDEVKFGRVKFAGWLRSVADRVVLGLIEKRNTKRRRPEGSIASLEKVNVEGNGRSASSILVKDEEQIRLRNAIASLSTDELRKIVELCFFENLSLKQISERIEITYDQVRYRFHAALRELEMTVNP